MSDTLQAPEAPQTLDATRAQIGDAFNFLEQTISKSTGQNLVTEPPQQEVQTTEQQSTPTTQQQVEEVAVNEPETPVEATETQVEDTDISDIPEGDKATEPAKMKWGELRKAKKHYDEILPKYQAQEAELEKLRKGEGIAEFDALKQKYQEQEARVADLQKREEEVEKKALMLDVKASNAYEKSVKQPFNQILNDAEVLANENNIDPNTLLDAILSKSRSKIQEVIGEWDEFSRTQAWDLLRNVHTVEKAKKDIEENPRGAYETIQKQQQEEYEKQTKQITERRSAEFDKLRPNLEVLLKDFPEKPNFDEIRTNALNIEALPDHHKVMAATAGFILPGVLDAYKERGERITALESELAEVKKESASLRNGGPRANSGSTPSPQQQRKETTITDPQKLADDIFSRLPKA